MELRGQLDDRNVSISINLQLYHAKERLWCSTAIGESADSFTAALQAGRGCPQTREGQRPKFLEALPPGTDIGGIIEN